MTTWKRQCMDPPPIFPSASQTTFQPVLLWMSCSFPARCRDSLLFLQRAMQNYPTWSVTQACLVTPANALVRLQHALVIRH